MSLFICHMDKPREAGSTAGHRQGHTPTQYMGLFDCPGHLGRVLTAAGWWCQVCEKMGDNGQASQESLAWALRREVELTPWSEKKKSDAMQQTLYSLPKHVRRIVLQKLPMSECHMLARFQVSTVAAACASPMCLQPSRHMPRS